MFCFTDENLVVIAGYDGSLPYLNDVELVSTQNNKDFCDPMDLDYAAAYHASVATDLGILTCGGFEGISKCTLQTMSQTISFPSMKKSRYSFGLGIVNDIVYAVGGYYEERTMEKINYKTDSEWTLTNLPFSVKYHCLTTTENSLVITGGHYYPPGVSKIILSLVNGNRKLEIKNQLQNKIFVYLDMIRQYHFYFLNFFRLWTKHGCSVLKQKNGLKDQQ